MLMGISPNKGEAEKTREIATPNMAAWAKVSLSHGKRNQLVITASGDVKQAIKNVAKKMEIYKLIFISAPFTHEGSYESTYGDSHENGDDHDGDNKISFW